MEIPKIYNPHEAEDKWYQYWMDHRFFKSVPDEREPYTIVIPPPNVTGILHMGHMLNNTVQDVLIRRARMLGKNACWVPGTDHASIATEAKVVAMLKERGINKADITREEFLKYAWEWKDKYGGIILDQLKKLGCSCDWDRTRFTMEEGLSDAVIDVFIDLYTKGNIYRGVRMVNWDPAGKTAVSDEEVIYKEVNSKLYYVRYQVEGSDEYVTVATTRPETILGDTAVCMHPDDERYKHLQGKRVIIPFVKRSVPIIYDTYITMEFGTGCLKVTPAHDINDYNIGIKHNLEVIDTINPDGTMSKAAQFYVGEDRFSVRKKIAKDLDEAGFLVKVEEIKNKVGYSERTDAVIEPKLSMQWFLKMENISKPALENVLNGNIKLIPEKFINTYKHWMENVHDWCISRQLWWGQRIPAWYNEKGEFVVAKTKEEAIEKFKEKNQDFNQDIRQEDDVVDTWFSSWLWPISVFDGFKNPDNADINYYYPTNDLITAPEILFFWVARMIIAGYEYRDAKPFNNVYLTGIVRDKLGRKMSKSLGNSPDALELIKKYGADGVRVGMLLCSPAGNDILFDESLCEQGRNFANKIWNAFRLIKGWEVSETINQTDSNSVAVKILDSKFNEQLEIINDLYRKYKISEALMITYKLVWDDFCAIYLEKIKPEFIDGMSLPIDIKTYKNTIALFEKLLIILHPFIPFITEEIWSRISERNEKDCVIVAKWPFVLEYDKNLLLKYENWKIDNAFVNKAKAEYNPIKPFNIRYDNKDNTDYHKTFNPFYIASSGSNFLPPDSILNVPENSKDLGIINLYSGATGSTYSFIAKIDKEAEKDRLAKELEYTKGFLESVMKKLSNEKFVANAKPEVIDIERKKQQDAETKIRVIEEQIKNL